MSISVALGVVAVVNLAIGYALALWVESRNEDSPSTANSPSENGSPPLQRELTSPALHVDQPTAVTEAKEPTIAVAAEADTTAADPSAKPEDLLESTEALAEELRQFNEPSNPAPEPRAKLGDAAQLEAAIHDWWHDDPQRTRPICVGQIEIDNLRQLTSQLDAASMGRLVKQLEHQVLVTLRGDDLVASLGRSRFLAVMPALKGSDAAQLLETLRGRVESMEFATDNGPIRTTISAAAAQSRIDENVESFLARSAAALREACSAGRNCVACDDGNSVTLVVNH